jgi:subtilisin family serine protease
MAKRNHLRLLGDKQLKEVGSVKFNYGFPASKDDEEEETPPNYTFMAESLRQSTVRYNSDLVFKYENRNKKIEIPADIDYIELQFVDQFIIKDYANDYYKVFGLEAASFSNFGRTGLFAIIDPDLFKSFLSNVKSFIEFGSGINPEATFSIYIVYIKAFKLLTSRDIIKFRFDDIGSVIQLELFELPLDYDLQNKLTTSLIKYLNSIGVESIYNAESNKLEVHNASIDAVKSVANNFDIIQSITCSLSSVVSPSAFNVVSRDYGFTIANSDDILPLIGVIDTGISMQTPLQSITIQDDTFSLNGNPLIDIAGLNRNGHGTAVAALAALGRMNHLNKFSGTVNADANLLSIKISETGNGYLSEANLIRLLYEAKVKYPNLNLFVLTTCYSKFKSTNEPFSNYTYELDKFSHRTNSLIVICTANNDACINENTDYDLKYFNSNHTNLCTPADSLNNLVVGAAAENLNNNTFFGISAGREYPTLYSRKSHIDLKSLYPKNKSNKNYFKPDVIECGGDVGYYNASLLDWADDSAMEVLSARPEYGFTRDTGTSLSAPLVANLAAKLIKEYPTLHIQTIKALIINGASLNTIRFPKNVSHLLNATSGHGFVDLEKTLFSEDSCPTLILEDTIKNGDTKLYPVNFPDYLIDEALGKDKRIIKITGTLCFSFEPIKNNQLSYNPVHLAFGFFKNHTVDQINSKKKDNDSSLRSNIGWSQSGRHVSKPIPYSNSQKMNFTIDLAHLISENKTLNLAVQCKLSEQIVGGIPQDYPSSFPFSLVIRFEENFKENNNRLYDELISVNNIEIIENIELEGDLDLIN